MNMDKQESKRNAWIIQSGRAQQLHYLQHTPWSKCIKAFSFWLFKCNDWLLGMTVFSFRLWWFAQLQNWHCVKHPSCDPRASGNAVALKSCHPFSSFLSFPIFHNLPCSLDMKRKGGYSDEEMWESMWARCSFHFIQLFIFKFRKHENEKQQWQKQIELYSGDQSHCCPLAPKPITRASPWTCQLWEYQTSNWEGSSLSSETETWPIELSRIYG